MDRFLSHFTNRLDAKGRVSIPAPFRAILARDGFQGLLAHASLDVRALDCGGNALLARIDGVLDTLPPYSEEQDTFSTALLGASEILKIDSEGRVILTEPLRTFAGISTEVSFVGLGHKFQIWEPALFRAHLAEARSRVRETRNMPGARQAADLLSRPRGVRE